MNTNKEIHIVSFNIPYPPNYGGVIDVFYKLVALSELGIKIHLHCFQYDRDKAFKLEEICASVHYYKRPKTIRYFLSKYPFIVITRTHKKLLQNLTKDHFPILLEGLHTCYFIPQLLDLSEREIIVRTHNIEHDYYRELYAKESNWIKKFYYKQESKKLRKYEKVLSNKLKIAAITEKDQSYFKNINSNTFYIPAFHSNNQIACLTGKGDYLLYHGDLSVNENIQAVKFIIYQLADHINYKIVIVGRNPSKKLVRLVNDKENITLIANPSELEMKDFIQNAHINLLLTWQSTGIKLKLINALFNGRFCIVNKAMVEGTKLDSACIIKNNAKEIIDEIKNLSLKSFDQDDLNKREMILLKNVNNKENAQKLINLFS